jgi:hypothetical protein
MEVSSTAPILPLSAMDNAILPSTTSMDKKAKSMPGMT